MNQLERNTVTSFIWKFLERGGNQAVALIVQIVMARLLTPDDFGILAIVLVFINIANVFVQSGLNTSLVQAKNINERDRSTIFWLSFCIAVVCFLLLWIAAPHIALFYQNDGVISPIRVLSAVLLIGSFTSVLTAIVQRSMQFKKIFVSSLIAVICSGVLGVALAICGAGIWALVAQQLAAQAITAIVLFCQTRWRPHLTFDKAKAKQHFSFGGFLLMSSLLESVYQGLSDFLIGKQFSNAQLGMVSQGKKYPQALSAALDGAIVPVILSAIAKIQDDIPLVKSFARRCLRTATFLIFPIMAMLAVSAEPLIRILLGEQWVSATPYFQIYCIAFAWAPVHSVNLQTLNAIGRSNVFFKLELVKKSYSFAVLLITVFVFADPLIVVAGIAACYTVSSFVNAIPCKKYISYSVFEQIKDLFPAALLSVISALATYPIWMLSLPDGTAIVANCAVLLLVYLALAKLIKLESLSFAEGLMKSLLSRLH